MTILTKIAMLIFSGWVLLAPRIMAQTIVWEKNYGGSKSERVRSIKESTDGGFIMACTTTSNDGDVNSNNGNADGWIIKLNQAGEIEWDINIGGPGFDEFFDIQQTTDNGYIATGYSNSNAPLNNAQVWVIKLNQLGDLLWEKTYGGSDIDYANSIRQTFDGGYLLAGGSKSNNGDVYDNYGETDGWLVKLNQTGEIEWETNIGGSDFDEIQDFQQIHDEGYILTGYTQSNDGDVTTHKGNGDIWVVKLDKVGSIKWEKTFGGSEYEESTSIEFATNGGYILSGYTLSNDGDVTVHKGSSDSWIIKIDEAGNIEWEKTFGGSSDDRAQDIQVTMDGGYIIAANSNSEDGDLTENLGGFDYWVLKLNANGDLKWQMPIGGSDSDFAQTILETKDGQFVIGGLTSSINGDISNNFGVQDAWLVKLESTIAKLNSIHKNQDFNIYPNPSSGEFSLSTKEISGEINIQIHNSLGELIYRSNNVPPTTIIRRIPKGMYWICIQSNGFSGIKRLIIQ